MRYTDENGEEQQTRFHGVRSNLDYAELVKRRREARADAQVLADRAAFRKYGSRNNKPKP